MLQRCCNIVAHVHDELIIEADRQMSLKSVCEQMERTPPWAGDLLLRVDGYETEFYKKDRIVSKNAQNYYNFSCFVLI